MKFVNLTVFLVSFSIGILLIYLHSPKKQIIYIYPQLDNLDKIQYKDRSNTCFNISAKEATCKNIAKPLFKDYKIQL